MPTANCWFLIFALFQFFKMQFLSYLVVGCYWESQILSPNQIIAAIFVVIWLYWSLCKTPVYRPDMNSCNFHFEASFKFGKAVMCEVVFNFHNYGVDHCYHFLDDLWLICTSDFFLKDEFFTAQQQPQPQQQNNQNCSWVETK